VVDDELAAAVEQVGQRLAAVRPVEDVLLVHRFPRQIAAPLAQAIAQARELFLLGQELRACSEPLVVRHDGVMHEVGHVLFLSYLVTS
jgi:hypothetical protein